MFAGHRIHLHLLTFVCRVNPRLFGEQSGKALASECADAHSRSQFVQVHFSPNYTGIHFSLFIILCALIRE